MTWSYRIILHRDHNLGDTYGVHEVYYDDAGNPTGWTEEPDIVGDDLDELARVLDQMRGALTKPVLVITDDEKLEEVSP